MTYIFANWKMYLDLPESRALAATLAQEKFSNEKIELAVFPCTLSFVETAKAFIGTSIAAGAQNVNWTPQGAYTGAVSAHFFKQAGAKYALVGHSERRYIFGETNDDARKKAEACLDEGIIPVLCIGETQEDLDAGKKEYRLKKQLAKVFENLNITANQNIIIAYEPVWAISKAGEGKPCTPDDADSTHQWIKQELKQYTDREIAVLYGGSVNAKNVLSYVARQAIDGVLVGSASTKFDELKNLVKVVELST